MATSIKTKRAGGVTSGRDMLCMLAENDRPV
jgi:hypothetical protein